jgi:hypothetical protein
MGGTNDRKAENCTILFKPRLFTAADAEIAEKSKTDKELTSKSSQEFPAQGAQPAVQNRFKFSAVSAPR